MKKVYIDTYGCTANQNDSEIMLGLLKSSGYDLVDYEKADYVIVNTCGVKAATEEKIIHKLKELSKTDKKIIIGGCLTKINLDRIKKTIPNFSAILDTKSIDKISDIVSDLENGNQIIKFSNKGLDKSLFKSSLNDVIKIVQISEGCLNKCTFCSTKLARGDLVSFRPENIREGIKQAVNNGAKEIHLTSQDMSAYGRDLGVNLVNLLDSIIKINGNFLIRIGMMNPLHFKRLDIKDLIRIYKNRKLFKFLHLCLQSGSNKILDKMQRGYKVKDFLYFVEQFKKEIPNLTLSTDIIVGFPEENKKDFFKTLDVIKEIKPGIVNISVYSNRKGTKASKMKQLNTEIKKSRTKVLSELVNKTSLECNKKWLNWNGEILIDEYNKEKGNFIGRNYVYKQVIVKGNFKLGEKIKVKIKGYSAYDLKGELV